MTIEALIEDMRRFSGSGCITSRGFAEYMGAKAVQEVEEILVAVPSIDGKFFFIPDISEVVVSCFME